MKEFLSKYYGSTYEEIVSSDDSSSDEESEEDSSTSLVSCEESIIQVSIDNNESIENEIQNLSFCGVEDSKYEEELSFSSTPVKKRKRRLVVSGYSPDQKKTG